VNKTLILLPNNHFEYVSIICPNCLIVGVFHVYFSLESFLIGRNGMHRYNNMDHSMLTAMTAVENIINNVDSKENL
jgi:hypothetical protein